MKPYVEDLKNKFELYGFMCLAKTSPVPDLKYFWNRVLVKMEIFGLELGYLKTETNPAPDLNYFKNKVSSMHRKK